MNMRSKIVRSAMIPFVIVFVAISILSGCGSKSDGGSSTITASNKPNPNASTANASTNTPKSRLKLSAMTPYWGTVPDTNGPLFKKLEDTMNADINATFVSGPDLMTKVNVTLASGDLPDIMAIFGIKSPPVINAIRSGAFWEVGKYIDQFPNLKAGTNKIADQNISVDGKIYQLYKATPISRQGFNLRQDWLDNLGMKQPKTVDDLVKVLTEFAKNDPDKDGKADTYGFVDYLANGGYPESYLTIASKFGVPNGFKVENGNFIPDFMTPEYRNVLKFYRQMYLEGIMNKDFAYIKQNQWNELMSQGKVGAHIGNVDQTNNGNPLLASDENVKQDSFSYLEGPTGNHIYAGTGYWVTLAFPKSSVKSEQELKDILAGLDRFAAPDMKEFRLYGIEGLTYKKENGKHVTINDALFKQVYGLSQYGMVNDIDADLLANLPSWGQDQGKIVQENENPKYLVANPSGGLISDTFTQNGAELNKIITDAFVKYVLGDLNDNDFDQVISKWKSAGGQKVLDEYAAAYKKIHG